VGVDPARFCQGEAAQDDPGRSTGRRYLSMTSRLCGATSVASGVSLPEPSIRGACPSPKPLLHAGDASPADTVTDEHDWRESRDAHARPRCAHTWATRQTQSLRSTENVRLRVVRSGAAEQERGSIETIGLQRVASTGA
jgi:hypothetical protein